MAMHFMFACVFLLAVASQWPLSTGYSHDRSQMQKYDIQSLLAFKERSLKDPNVTLSNWNPNDNHPCNWTGVTCTPGTYRVNRLSLPYRNLSGHLDAELGRLTHLQYLNISGNALTGGIPAELGRLKDLMVLDLSFNQLQSHIPIELGQCLALKVLNISYNNLTGPIPGELGELENLQGLYLSNNNLTGGIPEEFGKLKYLQFLQLGSNEHISGNIPSVLGHLLQLRDLHLDVCNLSGNVPLQIGQMSSLQVLNLSFNQLTGGIPRELAQLQNLTVLSLYNNKLNGGIPSELQHLKFLIYLFLGNNSLTGRIPPELGQLKNLRILYLCHNKLSGNIPKELGQLRVLKELYLENNELSGEIPPELSSLQRLYILSISTNKLTGYVPASLGDLESLEFLHLGHNRLHGTLPKSWARNKMLRVFLLEHNRLQGSLPTWIWGLSKLQSLDISNNLFTGNISPKISQLRIQKQAGQILSNSSDDFFFENDWTHILMWNFKGHEQVFPRIYPKEGFLDFSSNQIGGEIPSELGSLQGIRGLNLSNNKLVGHITPSLGNISNLESLDLSYNRLDGRIPEELKQIKFLAIMNMSYNNLSGLIPSGDQFNTFDNSSYKGNLNLCGFPLSKFCEAPKRTINTTYRTPSAKSSAQKKRLIVIVSTVAGIFLLSIFGLMIWFYWTRYAAGCDVEICCFERGLKMNATDLYNSTGGYSKRNIIGTGASSTVYKGCLANGQLVAIKKFKTMERSNEAECSFVTECRILGKIRHRNLVKILGTISSCQTKILVLQFMPNGSLDTHLHNSEICSLTWETRLKIALGIAQAIVYLHEESGIGQIVHCDLKPGNILLDQDFEAHVNDFGIARLIDPEGSGSAPSMTIRGSIGYVAPEFAYSQNVSPKADVYSYGVVLLEILTRKSPTDTAFAGQNSLVEWVRFLCPARAMEAVDDSLKQNATVTICKQIYSVISLALFCTQAVPNDRPSMREVLAILADIKGDNCGAFTSVNKQNMRRVIFEDCG